MLSGFELYPRWVPPSDLIQMNKIILPAINVCLNHPYRWNLCTFIYFISSQSGHRPGSGYEKVNDKKHNKTLVMTKGL